jgi:hypothetical protein
MKNEEIADFDRTDLGTIDRLLSHFEKQHLASFKERDPVEDYDACLEPHRRMTRFEGAVSSLKQLRESILSSDTRE